MDARRGNAVAKDIDILRQFFKIYCDNIHKERVKGQISGSGVLKNFIKNDVALCYECKSQFLYASVKRVICPFDPKPACKKCPSICYSYEHRVFMREMMRFSGRYLIFHGRLDLIFKYLF